MQRGPELKRFRDKQVYWRAPVKSSTWQHRDWMVAFSLFHSFTSGTSAARCCTAALHLCWCSVGNTLILFELFHKVFVLQAAALSNAGVTTCGDVKIICLQRKQMKLQQSLTPQTCSAVCLLEASGFLSTLLSCIWTMMIELLQPASRNLIPHSEHVTFKCCNY